MDAGRERAPTDFVTFRRFSDGFEIALLPPPRLKGTRKELIGVLLIAGFFLLIGTGWALVSVWLIPKEKEEGCLQGLMVGLGLATAAAGPLAALSQFRWRPHPCPLSQRERGIRRSVLGRRSS